jgi:hypothetical protein
MKKTFLFAALAALSMVSCTNEVLTDVDGYGTIVLSVNNDETVTRATRAVANLNAWIVTANNGSEDITLTTASTKVKEGTYTVSAKSHASEAEALQDKNNWGAAYYEGTSASVEVTPGSKKNVTVECGTAKNARLKVQFNLVSNFTEYNLTAERGLVFNSGNAASALAYYAETEEVEYTLNYSYNGTPKEITGKITMNGAATENIISIASNDNGTISVTINYDDSFGEGNNSTITFDAATGNQVAP